MAVLVGLLVALALAEVVLRALPRMFNWAIRQREQFLRRAIEKDPEFRQAQINLIRARKELQDWAERRAQESPEFAQAMQDWEQTLQKRLNSVGSDTNDDTEGEEVTMAGEAKVFIVAHDYEADYKVFFVDRESQEMNVRLISPGKLVKNASEANVKVCIVDREYLAEIKITRQHFARLK